VQSYNRIRVSFVLICTNSPTVPVLKGSLPGILTSLERENNFPQLRIGFTNCKSLIPNGTTVKHDLRGEGNRGCGYGQVGKKFPFCTDAMYSSRALQL